MKVGAVTPMLLLDPSSRGFDVAHLVSVSLRPGGEKARKRDRPSFRQNKEITFSCHGAVWANSTLHRCHPGKPEPQVVVSAPLQSCIFPSKEGGVSVRAPRPRPGAGSAQARERDVRAGGWLSCGHRALA